MTRIPLWLMVIIAIVLAVLGGRAISAQDEYSREQLQGSLNQVTYRLSSPQSRRRPHRDTP